MSSNRAGAVSSTVRVWPCPTPIPPKPPAAFSPPNRPCGPAPLIGCARVSTSGQLLDRQRHALAGAGCLRFFADKLSGKNADRPELAACLDYLRARRHPGRAGPGPAESPRD